MRHNWADIGLASVVLPALMLAQGIDFTKLVPALSQELRDAAAPRFRYDSEFAVDRAVSAQPRNAIVFDSEAIDPAARFQLEAGSHKFCLDGSHEYFTGVIVEDDVRFPVPATIDREGCARVVVATGVYTVRPTHRAGARPVPKVATVLTADLPSPPLLNPDGKPRNGFWAVYPASTKNPEPEPGRLRAAPPYKQFDFFRRRCRLSVTIAPRKWMSTRCFNSISSRQQFSLDLIRPFSTMVFLAALSYRAEGTAASWDIPW